MSGNERRQLDRAIETFRQGRVKEAQMQCEALLQRTSSSSALRAETLYLCAAIASTRKRPAELERCLRDSLALEPTYAPALYELASYLYSVGRGQEALAPLEILLDGAEHSSPAWTLRGAVLLQLQQRKEALDCFDRALVLDSNNAAAHINRGAVLNQTNRYAASKDAYDRALELAPDNIEALNGRGVTMMALGNAEASLRDFERALSLAPEHALSHVNASFTYLLSGNFLTAWPHYEWRTSKTLAEQALRLAQPQWLGQPVAGKHLLLHPEQGLGDTLHFCRYASLLAERGARVTVVVQPPLKALLESLDGVDTVLSTNDVLPESDYQCTYMSLPHGFSTTLESLPVAPSYLSASLEKRRLWRKRLAGDGLTKRSKPRIGIVWSGSSIHKNDHNRSVALTDLLFCLGSEADGDADDYDHHGHFPCDELCGEFGDCL